MTLIEILTALIHIVQTMLIAALTVCFALIAFFVVVMWATWRKR